MQLALFVWLAFPATLAVRIDSSFSQTGNVHQGTDADTSRIQELDVNNHSAVFKAGNFKILSLNVFGHRFAGPGERRKRLHMITTKIQEQNYDVVMLQEFFRLKVAGISQGSGTLREFRSNMTDLGLVYRTSSHKSNPKFAGLNAGVEIFSKHKIIEQEEHVYHKSKDLLAKKGFVVAKVDVGLQQPLIFIDVHTDNKDVSAKRSQMRQIKAAVDTHMTAGPVIVAGDFNICQQPKWDDGSLYKELASTMLPLRDLFGGDVVTFPDDGTAYDHFFLPPGPGVLSSTVVSFGDGEGRPTDHYGLVVELDPEQLVAGGGVSQDA